VTDLGPGERPLLRTGISKIISAFWIPTTGFYIRKTDPGCDLLFLEVAVKTQRHFQRNLNLGRERKENDDGKPLLQTLCRGSGGAPRFRTSKVPTPNSIMATDELAEIDGHKPKVLLADGQGREVKSTSR
jgi:hypothetical protein